MVKSMNRRKLIVISIGISIIAVTVGMIVFNLISDVQKASSNRADSVIIVPKYAFMVFPVILEELLLLRSVYKLVNRKPGRTAMICYIIAILLVLSALAFQILVNTHVITTSCFQSNDLRAGAPSSRLVSVMLLTEWTTIFVSFILGSLKP